MKSLLLFTFSLIFLRAEGLTERDYEGAIQKCLIGRCEMGQCDPNKLPAYSLGLGYTCDSHRSDVYHDCRVAGRLPADCLVLANAARNACYQDPCPHVEKICMDSRCKRTSNEWDCWKKEADGTLSFGYYSMTFEGEMRFVKFTGDAVPEETWKRHCKLMHRRCEMSLCGKDDKLLAPISDSYCSAKCYGHNCHHAAQDVCDCLTKNSVTDVRVVVFENSSIERPDPPGNVNHSMLTVPHPEPTKRERGDRCLIESQSEMTDGKIDKGCCYRTVDEFKNLASSNCKYKTSGPKKEPRDFSNARIYPQCASFLRDRGTQPSATRLTRPIEKLPAHGGRPSSPR